MATLFNMYQDTPRTDISGQLAQLRREEGDRADANWKGSKDLLRGAAVASIRKDYKNGISWDEGVKSADESFKRQYDRMIVADPQAAAQLREDYLAERTKRLNAEVAAAYKSKSEGVSGDIKALEQEIMQLESEIQGEEMQAQQAAQAEVDSKAAEDAQLLANNEAMVSSTAQMQGYRPNTPVAPVSTEQATAGLRSFYGSFPEPAPQAALPEPRSGMQTQQESPEASRMRGYRPLNAWYGGMR